MSCLPEHLQGRRYYEPTDRASRGVSEARSARAAPAARGEGDRIGMSRGRCDAAREIGTDRFCRSFTTKDTKNTKATTSERMLTPADLAAACGDAAVLRACDPADANDARSLPVARSTPRPAKRAARSAAALVSKLSSCLRSFVIFAVKLLQSVLPDHFAGVRFSDPFEVPLDLLRVSRSTTGRPCGQTEECAVRRSSSSRYCIFSRVSGSLALTAA